MRPLTAAPPAPRADRHVSLLDAEPDLAAQLPPGELPVARAVLRLPVVPLERDRPPVLDAAAPGTTWLVLSGMVMQRTVVAGRSNGFLLGAGDVLRWPPAGAATADSVSLVGIQAGAVAALDRRFRAAVQRWPVLGTFVEDRLCLQAHRCAVHAATCTLPRVQDRILAALDQVAESWGRVRRDGTYVELDVSHRRLGELIGAQRPTVTLALHELAAEDRLHRVEGGWLLRRHAVAPLVVPAPAPSAAVA